MPKVIKITNSVAKALEVMSKLIEGNLPGHTKPNWGWTNVKSMVVGPIDREYETCEEDGGHGKAETVRTGVYWMYRDVSFWISDKEYVTIHLINGWEGEEDSKEWKLDSITFSAEK